MQIKITLEQNFYEKLKANAKAHRRTLSAEINTILEEKYPNDEKVPPKRISVLDVPRKDSEEEEEFSKWN